VQFAGNDMQTAIVAYKNVAAYLGRVAAGRAQELIAPIQPLSKDSAMEAIPKLDAAAKKQLVDGLAALAKAFDADRKAWVAASTAGEFADLRHDVTILQQATRLYMAAGAGFDERDKDMAENMGWLLDQNPKARAVLWAHNGHVANKLVAFKNMGSQLDKKYGAAYVNIGFVFGEGSFQAIDFTSGAGKGLKPFTLGPPPETHASVPFSRTGKPILVLDLRNLPKGPVHDWFYAPHAVRDTGAGYSNERNMTVQHVLPELYDAVIYVDKTTRARPVIRRGKP
jgi:erythromycin esterase